MAANMDDGSAGGMHHEPRPEDGGLSDEYVDLQQLVAGRLADAIRGLSAAVQNRPTVAAAIVAGGVAAAIGLSLARRPRTPAEKMAHAVGRRATPPGDLGDVGRKGGRGLRKAARYGELIPLAVKLLENPIVRGLVVRAVTRQLTRRLK